MKTKLLVGSVLFCLVSVWSLFLSRALPGAKGPRSDDSSGERAMPDPICTKAGQFCVNRETSSGTCHVQEATERPQLGTNLKGPFKNRIEGNKAMCAIYDPGSGDSTKCGAVAPQGVCDAAKPSLSSPNKNRRGTRF
jgi:hypothetical protein